MGVVLNGSKIIAVTVGMSALLLASACKNEPTTAPVAPPSQKSEKVNGHHPPGYATSGLHGKHYMENRNSCTTCHGEDLKGGALVAFSCNKCHESFPHSREFLNVENKLHGAKFFADRLSCAKCHGLDYQGGVAKKSCAKCHTYPHPPKWAQAPNHGGSYVADLAEQRKQMDSRTASKPKNYNYDKCMKCHGPTASLKKSHPQEYITCKECHMPMPHQVKVRKINENTGRVSWKHHKYFARDGFYNCLNCHSREAVDPNNPNIIEIKYDRNTPNEKEEGCFACHDEESQITVEFPY